METVIEYEFDQYLYHQFRSPNHLLWLLAGIQGKVVLRDSPWCPFSNFEAILKRSEHSNSAFGINVYSTCSKHYTYRQTYIFRPIVAICKAMNGILE